MKERILTSLIAAFVITSLQAQTTPAVPRLVVGLTIDQLRSDYIEAFSALYGERGFKRLMREGRVLKEEIDNGISLIMCQTEKGEELLELTPFHLDNINIDEALKNNHQLRHPAIMPPKREQFFKEIKKGRNYNAVIARIYPKICLKQKIKNMIFVFRNSKKMS